MKKNFLILLIFISLISPIFLLSCSSQGSENDSDGSSNSGYEIAFVTDDNVSVKVYKTQDVSVSQAVLSSPYYARNKTTGEIDKSGSGQINFVIVPKTGYSLKSMSVSGDYNSIKVNPEKEENDYYSNAYRITKISGNLTVNISSKTGTKTGHKVTFDIPNGTTVTYFKTQEDAQNNSNGIVVNSQSEIYAVDGDSGVVGLAGEDQVNFKITSGSGTPQVTPESNFKNLKNPTETADAGSCYRVTKVTGDITVKIQ